MSEMQVPWAVTGPQIRKRGLITEFNSNKNTALVLAKIFGVSKLPAAWTEVVPNAILGLPVRLYSLKKILYLE